MINSLRTRGTNILSENGSIFLFAGLGLFLRFWQLGNKNFWLDELGVANAAFQSTISQTLSAANEHIMAMPLDYVVAWLTARISHAEGWLRLPEAIWGCLTLWAGYKLYTKLGDNQRVARLALLMLALSPILIEYSQELRFYAPLIFFFTYSMYLGLEAVEFSRPRDWLVFTLVTLLGIYFHLYTILAVGSVLLWLTVYFGKENWAQRRNSFALSALVLAAAFLVAMFTFGGVYAERKLSLFMYERFSTFLFTGLGWWPSFPASPSGWLLGTLFMLFALVGVLTCILRNSVGRTALLFYGMVLQIGMVILFDILRNYPLLARQIVMLAPTMIFFSARGVNWLIEQIIDRLKLTIKSPLLTIGVVILIILAAFPALNDYYQVKKGSQQDILSVLTEHWQTQESIHVEVGALEVFAYYWSRDSNKQSLVHALTPLDYNSSDKWDYPAPAWLVINYPPSELTEAALRSAGFVPFYMPPSNTLYPQMLWRRK